jgi:glutaminase
MSVSKPFAFALMCQLLGTRKMRLEIGVNATGLPFNSVAALENARDGRTNPMVNSGAIAVTSYAPDWEFLHRGLSAFAGRALELDQEVYASAVATNQRNRALAQLLLSFNRLGQDPDTALDLYTRQCSLLVTATDLAVMAATLADGGVNPVTGATVVDEASCHAALAVMATAGLYETSGDWLYNVGLPGKSGIGGGIITVSPGKAGLGTFAPRLDEAGNSIKGQLTAEFLSRELGLDLFAATPL